MLFAFVLIVYIKLHFFGGLDDNCVHCMRVCVYNSTINEPFIFI